MATAVPYSFASVTASFVGPNGSFQLGYGAGVAEEGITIAYDDEDSTTTTGAGGEIMHSINASKTATITVRILKTSPVNQQLMTARNLDKGQPSTAGQNVITIRDIARGDTIIASQCAFRKVPDLTYGKTAGTNEWSWRGSVTEVLGSGT